MDRIKFPCINCITLPICKSQVLTQLHVFQEDYQTKVTKINNCLYSAVMMTIYNKCSILQEHLKSDNEDDEWMLSKYSPIKVGDFSKEFMNIIS